MQAMTLQDVLQIALIGIGATMVMDIWLAILKRAGISTLDFALVGRWVGHLGRGRFNHVAIARSTPVPGERALGWVVHYAVGISFAGLIAAVGGLDWVRSPTLPLAVGVGFATVVAPLFVMQPAMGAGIASSRTRAPVKAVLRSLVNHSVFGVGLYLAALLVQPAFA